MNFQKVFIANRGEIARRIAKTLRQCGLKSVCIGDPLKEKFLAPYVDEVICPELAQDRQSFLNADLMIKLAKEYECDAIHPGFGFLSENHEFAQKIIDAGLTWIGPNPGRMKAMASKESARELAEKSDVPVLPGVKGIRWNSNSNLTKDLKTLVKQAGFPLLIKAAFGGGGKGMRIAYTEAELLESLERCSSEAKASFGDDLLIVEKYLENSRHVEVQVLGDQHGNVQILGDRDCSMQRRHQKIIEEAPAPALNAPLREAMQTAALNLAKTVGYDSTGTVEFLVDASVFPPKDFYFLEMNTRLQVEHPVTEEIFDTDLVEQQLKSASQIKLSRDGIIPPIENRHSIEVRIYAEDSFQNFLPMAGDMYCFIPAKIDGIRWEIGMDSSATISGNFDPMIAKCIATASSRDQARKKLSLALKQTRLHGTTTNREFLIELLENSAWTGHEFHTNLIEAELESHLKNIEQRNHQFKLYLQPKYSQLAQLLMPLQSSAINQFTNRAFSTETKRPVFNIDYETHFVQHLIRSGNIQFQNEWCMFTTVESELGDEIYLQNQNASCTLRDPDQLYMQFDEEGHSSAKITAPVPGKVIKVVCKQGDSIEKDQTLMIIESMKMEFEIKAPRSATIESVFVAAEAQVLADQELVALDANAG